MHGAALGHPPSAAWQSGSATTGRCTATTRCSPENLSEPNVGVCHRTPGREDSCCGLAAPHPTMNSHALEGPGNI
eukprot:750316-Alexandrium_andersonii.AAC.1